MLAPTVLIGLSYGHHDLKIFIIDEKAKTEAGQG